MAYIWILKLLLPILCVLTLRITSTEGGELRDLMLRCPEGSFGYRCRYRCRCLHDEPCDKSSGMCYEGCAAGFWGPGCQLSDNCFYNGQARHYQGRVSVTKKLSVCQRWDSQDPHRHSYNREDFPDQQIPDNFCRTTKDSSQPWCYTTDKRKRWEDCRVNNCNCPLGRFGHNCEKECHCKESGEACESIMGICNSGCAEGWIGFDCQTPERCPRNMYGWDCSQRCYCTNPDHCDRFTGPTPLCMCQDGYFNAPFCEPVTRPRILHFGNKKSNEGQPSVFNCTVAAFPTPRETEIRLVAPTGKRVTMIQSTLLDGYLYTRSSLFQVNLVNDDEKYSCVVRAVAGEASFTTIADVYQRPMLVNPPRVLKSHVTGSDIPLEWPPWNRAHGDTGDPPITWYSLWVKRMDESAFSMVSVVPQFKCHVRATCNYTLSDLKPNTEYHIYISVRREGDDMDGPPGPMIYVKTKCAEPTASPTIKSITGGLQTNATYAKAKLTVTWEDPPVDTWGCESIQKYQILVANQEPQVLLTHVARGVPKRFEISELEPAIKYCVSMKFENSGGYYSPQSPEKCKWTPTSVPKAPTDLEFVSKTSTTLTISWQRPKDVGQNVTTYTIIYWKGYVKELSTKKGVEWESEDALVEFTLTGLEPGTSYYIQVQALNEAGAGEYSNKLSVSTAEGRPGPVTRFRNISRTQTSIMLQWQAPEKPTDELLTYLLNCSPSGASLPTPTTDVFRLSASLASFNYTGLKPTTQYQCSINASSALGTGPRVFLLAWTLARDPVEPPSPMILGRSDNTVTLEIEVNKDESISFYRIIVEQVVDRRRRSVPDKVSDTSSDYETATKEGSSVYVAAQLDSEDALGTFVVGDNKTYGGFLNAPLNSNKKYNIWFGAYTETDEGLRKSITKAIHRSVDRSAITAVPPTNHVPVIIGVLIVFIVLILVVALLLFIWRKKHIQSEREKAEMPNFGPTIIPEPDLTPPSTPVEHFENDPLIEASFSSDLESEPIYGNTGFMVLPVKVEDLWDYVKNNKCNDCEGFRREYKLIPAGITACCEAARKSENKEKNRYGNIVAYDHTRVVLNDSCKDEHDDYINANYIDGYNKRKAYIASQGPTKSTLKDIWRMVWQEQSKTIIMLTNPTETGKKKCEFYWPDDDVQEYNGITVEVLSTDDLPDFTTRNFKLTKDGIVRKVKQFHYTTWPDHGVPSHSSSLLLLRQKIRSHDNLDSGPQVIHCSAGVGRTGTYIAIDAELERAKTEGIIDVHNFVQLMRTHRINMVQTMDQYVFVYDCLLEALISGDTFMRADEYPDILSEMCQYDNVIQKTKLEEQFDILRLITTTLERDESTTALRAENIFKNRCKTIIPANRNRPYLMTLWDGCNDYINAVFTNSYTRRDGFILTQMPLPNTVIDFWRLVHDQNVCAIVMLNETDPADETSEQYWSLESCGENYGPFIVETTAEIKNDPSITVRDFTLTNTEMPHAVPRVVRQFHFHRWADESPVPSSKLALFELLDMVDTCQRHSGNRPVVVHCLNGATRSGLYVAVSILVERLKLEKEIDVFQTVKQLRLCRNQLVDNLEQYRYCHEIVLDYINSTNTLTTFTAPSSTPPLTAIEPES